MRRDVTKKPLELPEYLTAAEMAQFMSDPNIRAQRRMERLGKLAPVAGRLALRGRKRDWLNPSRETVTKPDSIDSELVKLLTKKLEHTKPLTDPMTERYDILPNAKSAETYGWKHLRNFLNRIENEERDPERIKVLQQGAARKIEHIRDNLQINLWLKTNIAQLRLAHVDTILNDIQAGNKQNPESVKQTGWAIADLGFCLRKESGVLANIGQDLNLAHAIENTGDYIADGHPEVLVDNLDLVWLTRQEQAKRAIYWGERYEASVQALGKRLPDDELAMASDLDQQVRALYSQHSDEYRLAA